MKMNSNFRRLRTSASSLMMVCGLLLAAPSIWAQSDDDGICSNKTLRGDYGFTIEGVALAGPFAGPWRGVALTHFDGKGSLTQVDHVVMNGVSPTVDWRPATGTYVVNPNCTGSAQILLQSGPTVNLRFVVVNNGREIRTVVTGAAAASTSNGVRVD